MTVKTSLRGVRFWTPEHKLELSLGRTTALEIPRSSDDFRTAQPYVGRNRDRHPELRLYVYLRNQNRRHQNPLVAALGLDDLGELNAFDHVVTARRALADGDRSLAARFLRAAGQRWHCLAALVGGAS